MEMIVTLLNVTELINVSATESSSYVQLLVRPGRKANRILYSTSYAEALAINADKGISIVTVMRLIKILFHDFLYNVDTTIKALENGKLVILIDQSTDCNDTFENISETLPLPTDKAEWLYVQSMREERTFCCIIHCIKVPGFVKIDD